MRFAFGTLTALPVRVHRWDRAAARGGMAAAPLVGLLLGALAAGAGRLLLLAGAGAALAAVVTVAVPAVLTRGLHLDGLADTADGLGSGRPAAGALAVMRRSDIGPFGVITLLLVLLGQVAAVAELYGDGSAIRAAVAVTAAAVAARAALTLAARTGVPPARPEGLGAAVAGVLSARTAVACTAVAAAVLAAAAGLLSGPYAALHTALAVTAGLAAAELLRHHCVRRLGGVTGDVFGALAETAATAALIAAVLGPA
ncbi:adenosylcobinamide-GDP ribazoletransferase [Streptomyces sp. WAC 06738]|uniref:adenosylcobinamide-GDP ribazoletransferase n=1 Tax=Streptomyces sp. WAC 06738 TaxID=2203210 RepID=UPI000F6F96A3|nr:adenosylcobinamide-GDP ribazoletransferase [Streptomyces sp. WAC 06738]AZM50615.1 adenosylcobinamide-GDP ribazoletransferase [Streptomyces sp. WAC 06738]